MLRQFFLRKDGMWEGTLLYCSDLTCNFEGKWEGFNLDEISIWYKIVCCFMYCIRHFEKVRMCREM